MNNVTHLVQKVHQAPWRIQRQWIGLFMLVLVLVAMVAGIYLNVTTRAALAGREIQRLEEKIINNQRTNADYETQLAGLTSTEIMQNRAQGLGFEPARPEDITYVTVPGYLSDRPVDLSTDKSQPVTPILLPEYSESLFDWFARTLAASKPVGDQP